MSAPKAKTAASRVEVSVPKGYLNEEPNLFVSVNGVNYLLPRGKKSLVPPEVAHEIFRAIDAQEQLDATIGELLKGGRQQ